MILRISRICSKLLIKKKLNAIHFLLWVAVKFCLGCQHFVLHCSCHRIDGYFIAYRLEYIILVRLKLIAIHNTLIIYTVGSRIGCQPTIRHLSAGTFGLAIYICSTIKVAHHSLPHQCRISFEQTRT